MELIQDWVPALYLVAAVSFVIGLKGLSGPDTAVAGNRIAALGMLLAVVATAATKDFQAYGAAGLAVTVAAIAVGSVIGIVSGMRIQMTAMPQMVALFNGLGGGASAIVASLEYIQGGDVRAWGGMLSTALGLLIGGVTLSGSLVAFAKLQGILSGRAYKYPGQIPVTIAVVVVSLVLTVLMVGRAAGVLPATGPLVMWALALMALVLGVVLVMPIGGADMPVVIALLNSYSGLAAAMAGLILENQLLVVAGMLVGASGVILTQLMSKAMNRSLTNILFGGVGAGAGTVVARRGDDTRNVRELTAEDAAILLGYAQDVIVVPGYGLAVAQAQHAVRDLADLLEARGVNVRYAIHPVAGRMPGHMNVLLAEANVPYEKLKDMDEINEDFKHTDVALVIGANDVTNPAARTDKGSPIYGMPILNVDQAKNVIVIKRSMRSGFAGIDNELYLDPKTGMLFGDAKAAVEKVIAELKKAA